MRPRATATTSEVCYNTRPFSVARFLPALPLDRPILSLEELSRRALSTPGATACVGVEGSGPALVAQRLLRDGAPRVVCLCADTEAAQRTTSDLSALSGGLGFASLPAS